MVVVIVYLRTGVVLKCMTLMFRFISREDFGGLDNENKVKSSHVFI